MICRSLILLLVLAMSGQPAQSPSRAGEAAPRPRGAQSITETRHLRIASSTPPSTAGPGSSISLFVDVAPKPKMHVYAPQQKDYIPITLTLTSADAFRADAPRYPKAEKFFFAPLKETQLVYSRPFRITQPVTLTRAPVDGPLTITGTLRYQACDDAICYLPQEVAVSWTVRSR
jgi:DsbC/DsbD-like thiol-disulfide interchange protein